MIDFQFSKASVKMGCYGGDGFLSMWYFTNLAARGGLTFDQSGLVGRFWVGCGKMSTEKG